jgi:hypothetical protein
MIGRPPWNALRDAKLCGELVHSSKLSRFVSHDASSQARASLFGQPTKATRHRRNVMINPTCRFRLWPLLALALLGAIRGNPSLQAHELPGHKGPTYQITAPAVLPPSQNRLILNSVEGQTGKPVAARFSVKVHGREYIPESSDRPGLRLVAIHEGKKQRTVACYSQGTSPVEVPLPADVQSGIVTAAKGFEHLPIEQRFTAHSGLVRVTLRLQPWSDLRDEGCLPRNTCTTIDGMPLMTQTGWEDTDERTLLL